MSRWVTVHDATSVRQTTLSHEAHVSTLGNRKRHSHTGSRVALDERVISFARKKHRCLLQVSPEVDFGI